MSGVVSVPGSSPTRKSTSKPQGTPSSAQISSRLKKPLDPQGTPGSSSVPGVQGRLARLTGAATSACRKNSE